MNLSAIINNFASPWNIGLFLSSLLTIIFILWDGRRKELSTIEKLGWILLVLMFGIIVVPIYLYKNRELPTISNQSDTSSYIVPRVVATIGALFFTIFQIFVIHNQLLMEARYLAIVFAPPSLGIEIVAIFCWWFALRGHVLESRRRMKFAIKGGLILGGIGFVGGIVMTLGSNLGPLVGIFFTGPIGLFLGFVGGYFYSIFHTPEQILK